MTGYPEPPDECRFVVMARPTPGAPLQAMGLVKAVDSVIALMVAAFSYREQSWWDLSVVPEHCVVTAPGQVHRHRAYEEAGSG